MNTPKSRKPRRYTAPMSSEADDEADYEPGILQPLMAEAMGSILTLWPHVEGHMIFVFRELTASRMWGMRDSFFEASSTRTLASAS